jgi:hypothetical protein
VRAAYALVTRRCGRKQSLHLWLLHSQACAGFSAVAQHADLQTKGSPLIDSLKAQRLQSSLAAAPRMSMNVRFDEDTVQGRHVVMLQCC